MQTPSEIVNQIKQAVKIAASTPQNPEKKLRELVSPIWVNFLKEKRVDLNLQIEDELILANGKADTVFNKLILEYKKPYIIKPDNAKNRQLISQVQGYMLDLAKARRFSKERLLGVAFDGDHFLFMRYIGRWIYDDPLPVNESSLELFLKNLEKLTSKAALIPENLIRDFAVGSKSHNKVAVDCIKAFYHELNQHGGSGETKEHFFFEQWKVQFAEVHGSLEQKKIDKETLFTSYGFSRNEQKDFNVFAFFFALDSYYALLMKLLSYQVVGYYTISKLTGLPLHDWESLDSDDLRKRCGELEEGGIFRSIGIRNFLEGDLFSWYIQAWNVSIYEAIQQIIKYLNDYDPETMEIAPDETRDILKKLYQYLVPKQIRHDLGEYYTPDWLAERCLNQVGYGAKDKDLFKKRLLDPGCGSGTFVILGIKRAKDHAVLYGKDPAETLKYITMNIMGFDLNPLAVISARTNYMMAIADLLKYKKGEITIPVYLCDSINPPQARIAHEKTLFAKEMPYEVKTTVGNFYFSHSIISKKRIQQLANLLEDGVKAGQTTNDFLKKVERELQLNAEEVKESESYLVESYEKLIELERKGINGVWARIIKNAFAPLFVGQFDLVVGNPPWVNWEALPQGYRDDTKPLWVSYGLFSLSGHEARLGGGKKDISMLMMYVAIDKYLQDDGKLCFVITQTLFKTHGAGDGFRRFKLGEKGKPFKIEQVDDMVDLQPFEGATNKTSVVMCLKGKQNKYPVPYLLWERKDKGKTSMDLTFEEVLNATLRYSLVARPIEEKETSPWLTTKPKISSILDNVIGESLYQARAGCCGWLNSIYLVIPLDRKDGFIKINNYTGNAKKEIKEVEAIIEEECVFPTLRGKEIKRWIAQPEIGIISAQEKDKMSKGIPLTNMKEKYPKTFEYFNQFKSELEGRSGYKKYLEGEPFYTVYNFGPHTLATYKVVWTRVGNDLRAAVCGNFESALFRNLIIMPIETVVFVPFNDLEEAHYFCALINSSISRLVISSYSNKGTGSFGSPHILKHIKIPKYDLKAYIHQNLSKSSKQCHEKVASDIDISDLEEQIDELAAELWGLTKEELKDIKDSLEELK